MNFITFEQTGPDFLGKMSCFECRNTRHHLCHGAGCECDCKGKYTVAKRLEERRELQRQQRSERKARRKRPKSAWRDPNQMSILDIA
jgi:hypothetical protein